MRYIGLLETIATAVMSMEASISSSGCIVSWWISEVGMDLITLVVQATMIMRLYALSRKSRGILSLLLACFLAEQLSRIVVFANKYLGIVVVGYPFSDVYSACSVDLNVAAVWAPLFDDAVTVAFQTLVVFLTVFYCAMYLRSTGQTLSPGLLSKDDIGSIFVRDNLLFCLLVDLPKIFGMAVALNVPNSTAISVAAVTSQALWTVIGPRTILNIRAHHANSRLDEGPGVHVQLAIKVHTETVTYF